MTTRLPAVFLQSLLLIAAIFALYRPALDFGFVWDDQLYVVKNAAVHDWSRAAEAFISPSTTWSSNSTYYISEWRPLRNISYLIDYSIYGLNPIGWHLTNIMLHAAAALLLLFLLRRLVALARASNDDPDAEAEAAGPLTAAVGRGVPGPASIACFLAAAFWALHPVQTEVVAWVKSRDDLLAAPFMLAALLIALPRPARRSIHAAANAGPHATASAAPTRVAAFIRLLAASALFICALLSKENSVVLTAIFPVILILMPARSFAPATDTTISIPATDSEPSVQTEQHPNPNPTPRFPPRAAIFQAGAFIIIGIIFLAIRDLVLGRTGQAGWPGSPAQTLFTMFHAFTRYIRLILWPWPPTVQSADYDAFPLVNTWLHPGVLAGLTILGALIIIALVSAHRRRRPLLAIGIITFLLALMPFANIIPMMQIMAERFLYMPLLGAAIMITALLPKAGLRAKSPSPADTPNPSRPDSSTRSITPAHVIAFIIICALSVQTSLRLPVWKSELALFADTRQANPTSWRPADNYIKALIREGQTTAALTAANQALRRWPNDPDIIRTVAVTNLMAGNEQVGIALTNRVSQLQPNDHRAYQTLRKWQQIKHKEKSSTNN